MDAVYLLIHSYVLDGADETKIIGAYVSKAEAQRAVKRTRAFVGFRDHPRGFHISRLELGRDQWSEGFITDRVPMRTSKKSQRRSKK